MYYPPSSLIATGILLPLLGVASTVVRFWIRLSYHPNPIAADDWIIVFGVTIVMCLGIMQVIDTVYGDLGDEVAAAAIRAIVKLKIDYVQVIVEKVAFGCIKLSILFFYRRIFGRWPDFLRYNNVLVGLITVWTLTYLVSESALCGSHPEVQWTNHSLAGKVCLDHGALLLSFAVTDVFTDLLVIGMPIPFIHRLQISRRQKWGLAAVFFMGFLSTFAGILRLSFLSVLRAYGQFQWNPRPLTNPPKVFAIISPLFWTNFELCTGVISANLMTFAPLIRRRSKAKQVTGAAVTTLLEHGTRMKSKVSATSTSFLEEDNITSSSPVYTVNNTVSQY